MGFCSANPLSMGFAMLKKKRHKHDQFLLALGEAIRSRRLELKLTQDELGTAANLHRTYITEVENGSRNLSLLTLVKLVSALHCPISQIMIETERLHLVHATV